MRPPAPHLQPPASRLKPLWSGTDHLIPDEQKEQLAIRQANAAVALLRLQQADQVWPLLKHQPDPRLRSYLLDRLASHGADPESLWQRLTIEKETLHAAGTDPGPGEFRRGQAPELPPSRPTISAELLRLYQEDPDPGIHGAAEWTLKQLGQQAELANVRSALATGEVRRPAPLVRDEARAAHDGDSGAAGTVPDGVTDLRGGTV